MHALLDAFWEATDLAEVKPVSSSVHCWKHAQPIFERYYMTFVVVWQSAESPKSEPALEQHCHLLAQKISMLYGINAPDFFDRQLFRHFIETALDLGYLVKNDADALVFAESFEQVNLDIRNLLSVEVRSTMLSLI